MTGIVHHVYDEDGNLRIWNTARAITVRSFTYTEFAHRTSGVIVEAHGVPVLRFESERPAIDAGILANLIFQTSKEFAS